MRYALILAALTIIGCTSKEHAPTLVEMRADEDSGILDDTTKSEAKQIEAVNERMVRYLDAATTPADSAAIKASLKRAMERIMDRARQRVKDAERQLNQVKERATPKESA